MRKIEHFFSVMLFIWATLAWCFWHHRMRLFQFEGSTTAIPLNWKMECISVTSALMHRKLHIRINLENLWP